MSDFKLEDHSGDAKKRLEKNIYTALDTIGMFLEGEARDELENSPRRVDTGRLKGSIGHQVDQEKQEMHIGTNVEYAVYVHEGTGKYHPNGRMTPWVYKSEKDGKFYRTDGMPPNRFLKNAVDENADQVKEYLDEHLKKF